MTDKFFNNAKKYVEKCIDKEWLSKQGYSPDMKGVYSAFKTEKGISENDGPSFIKNRIIDWLEGLPGAFDFEYRQWEAALIVGKEWLCDDEKLIELMFDQDQSYYYDIYKETIAAMILFWKSFMCQTQ